MDCIYFQRQHKKKKRASVIPLPKHLLYDNNHTRSFINLLDNNKMKMRKYRKDGLDECYQNY